MTIKFPAFFSLSSFVLSSLLINLIISIPSLGFLRVYLIVFHLIFFYFLTIYKYKKIFKNKVFIFIYLLIAYVLFQNIFLQEPLLSVIQGVATVIFLFLTAQISQSEADIFYLNQEYKRLSKILLFLLPFFFISFGEWSAYRKPGLFMNPNGTSHLSIMLLPFIFLGLDKAKYKYLATFLVFGLVLITASRSALMALLLSLLVYISITVFPRINFLGAFLIILSVILLSMYSVDIVVWVLDKSSYFNDSGSRLFYTGYNGRDILMDYAINRFEAQPVLGLGFDGSKFEIDGNVLATHNGLIEVLIKFGIAGSLVFFLFCLNILWMVSKHNDRFKAVAMMSLSAIFSLSTNSSTFFVLNYLFIYVIILVFIGYQLRNKDIVDTL